MQGPTAAPRFRAYLDHTLGALVMQRAEWHRLLTHAEQLAEIDVTATPMGAIISASEVVGTFAERTSEGKAVITIIRNDPADYPDTINIDRYEVWEDVRDHIDVSRTVVASSTNEDLPFLQFHEDYVMVVPLEKGADHQLPLVPGFYLSILEARRPGA